MYIVIPWQNVLLIPRTMVKFRFFQNSKKRYDIISWITSVIGVQVVIIICNIDSFSNLCIDTKLSFEQDAMKKAIAVLKML